MYTNSIRMSISVSAVNRCAHRICNTYKPNRWIPVLSRFNSSSVSPEDKKATLDGFVTTKIQAMQKDQIKDQKLDLDGKLFAEETEDTKLDLESVGVATSQTLTIADVLASQESKVTENNALVWKSISSDKTAQDAVSVMVANKLGALIVMHDAKGIAGIVTERDIMNKTSPKSYFQKKHPIKDVMSSHIMCIPTNTTIIDALACMIKENFRHLSVISDVPNAQKNKSEIVPIEAVRCVLSIKDIVRAYAQIESHKPRLAGNGLHAKRSESKDVADKADAQNSSENSKQAELKASVESADTTSIQPEKQINAATLLKKKHKSIKQILNTRVDDYITVAEAVEAMVRQDFGSVLVVDKDQSVHGIFTEHDYLTKVLYRKRDPNETLVTEVCTKEITSLQIDDSLEVCWTMAVSKPFRHFPVVTSMRKDRKEPELAGILSIKDIVREVSKGRQTTKTFWLLDFFKSKMESKTTEKSKAPNVATANDAAPKSVPLESNVEHHAVPDLTGSTRKE